MKVLKIILKDIATTMYGYFFLALNLIWICSVVGLIVSMIALALYENWTGKTADSFKSFCLPGSALRKLAESYVESVRIRSGK
jgi:hypothetical protein